MENVTATSFDIQVLDFPPSSNTSTHTFVSADSSVIGKYIDPLSFNAINIESVTATTITIQTLANAPSSNTSPHTFVTAATNAVVSGGNYTHRFLGCCSGCSQLWW